MVHFKQHLSLLMALTGFCSIGIGQSTDIQLSFQTSDSDMTITVPLDSKRHAIGDLQCDKQNCGSIQVSKITSDSLKAMTFICTIDTEPQNTLGPIVGVGWQISPPATITHVTCEPYWPQ
jgi:hypothetical protein